VRKLTRVFVFVVRKAYGDGRVSPTAAPIASARRMRASAARRVVQFERLELLVALRRRGYITAGYSATSARRSVR
jgi:hypothetical protein